MFGVLSNAYKKDLVYPTDKTRRKTYERILSFFTGVLFAEASEIIYNGCAASMTEILEFTFPELLEPDAYADFVQVFLEPLFQILRHEKGASTSKNANAAACYCLRRIVEYLRTK